MHDADPGIARAEPDRLLQRKNGFLGPPGAGQRISQPCMAIGQARVELDSVCEFRDRGIRIRIDMVNQSERHV